MEHILQPTPSLLTSSSPLPPLTASSISFTRFPPPPPLRIASRPYSARPHMLVGCKPTPPLFMELLFSPSAPPAKPLQQILHLPNQRNRPRSAALQNATSQKFGTYPPNIKTQSGKAFGPIKSPVNHLVTYLECMTIYRTLKPLCLYPKEAQVRVNHTASKI